MNKKVSKRLAKVAKELPLFEVAKDKTTMMYGHEYYDHLHDYYAKLDQPVPEEKLMMNGKPLKSKENWDKVFRVVTTENVMVDHMDGLKKAYLKGGIEGVEQYCKEVTRYHLARQRKLREAQKDGVANEA